MNQLGILAGQLGRLVGEGIKKQLPLLTPSIDNAFVVPLRNRDEGGGDSIQGVLVNKAVGSRETDDN